VHVTRAVLVLTAEVKPRLSACISPHISRIGAPATSLPYHGGSAANPPLALTPPVHPHCSRGRGRWGAAVGQSRCGFYFEPRHLARAWEAIPAQGRVRMCLMGYFKPAHRLAGPGIQPARRPGQRSLQATDSTRLFPECCGCAMLGGVRVGALRYRCDTRVPSVMGGGRAVLATIIRSGLGRTCGGRVR
jgi:hypothetical protein